MVFVNQSGKISLGLRVFRSFKTPAPSISEEWKTEIGPFCGTLIESPEKDPMLYIMEMEIASHSSLDYFIDQVIKSKNFALSTNEISIIVFQLTFAMHVLQNELGLRHHDLKADNIFVFKEEEQVLPWTSLFPYILKVGDFGLSRTIHYRGLEKNQNGQPPNWLFQPVDWLLTAGITECDDLKIDPETVTEDADVWSFGLLIIHTVLAGLDISKFKHFRGDKAPVQETLQFSYLHFFTLVTNYITFEAAIYHELIEKIGDDRETDELEPKIKLLAIICQVQEALNNGFLPTWIPKKERNAYYKNLNNSKNAIIDSCRMKVVREEEKEEEEEDDDDDEDKDNPNLFVFLVEELHKRIGNDGLDFVRRCMSWNPEARRKFLDVNLSSGKVMFGAALEHPFLSEFKNLIPQEIK